MAGAYAYQNAGGTGAHKVQSGTVGGAASHDDRHIQFANKRFEVQRFHGARYVLGRNHGALNDQHVEAAF